MATIKEIAELAGVSRGTVDRVLNNRGSVNPETADKIKEIAKALDYRPNRAGLVLAAQKKKLKIGIILFSADNPFFEDVIRGIRTKAEELSCYNCTVIIKQVHFNIEEQIKALDELTEEGVNGIALAPYNDMRVSQRINSLFEDGIPVITLNTDIEHSKRIAYVGSNYTHSGETAAGLMHLITQGVVNLGIISGSSNILCHTQRIAGFQQKIKKDYPNIHIIDIIENHDDDFESYDKTTTLLKSHPEINALFFAAGGVYGGCRAVKALNREKALCILTFDNVPTTRQMVEQGIIAATICQQPSIQGSKPLELLFTYLTTGEMPDREHYYVEADIRIRENI